MDDFVTVSDADMRAAMRVMLGHLKLAGLKTGLLICGANIDAGHFQALIATDG